MTDSVRYRVVHETCYDYSEAVVSSHQLAHLTPRATAWQTIVSHHLAIAPEPAERSQGIDYFGNGVVRVFIENPHESLVVHAESVVEVRSHAPDLAGPSPNWELAAAVLPAHAAVDIDLEQYRVASPMAPILDAAAEYARESFTPTRPWLEAAFELTRRIRREFTYDPTATTVTTRVAEVLATRRGVCQDFAHLMISCFRSLGLPACYVSGYVLNRVAPGQIKLAGADASHAWVAAHCPTHGWVAFDPTNGKIADLEFVTLGWGREFSDVTPLRGIVLGAATQEMRVAVSVDAVSPLPETLAAGGEARIAPAAPRPTPVQSQSQSQSQSQDQDRDRDQSQSQSQ